MALNYWFDVLDVQCWSVSPENPPFGVFFFLGRLTQFREGNDHYPLLSHGIPVTNCFTYNISCTIYESIIPRIQLLVLSLFPYPLFDPIKCDPDLFGYGLKYHPAHDQDREVGYMGLPKNRYPKFTSSPLFPFKSWSILHFQTKAISYCWLHITL